MSREAGLLKRRTDIRLYDKNSWTNKYVNRSSIEESLVEGVKQGIIRVRGNSNCS